MFNAKLKTNVFPEYQLMPTWSAINKILVLCLWSLRKSESCPFFSVKFLSKSMYIYHMDVVLSLILIVSQMLKFPRTKVEVHFLNKFVFVTNKCLAQNAFRNRKPFKIHCITRRVMCTIFLFSEYFNAILVSELYLLSRCTSPYKQSLS